jgi:MoxR-like ATPase
MKSQIDKLKREFGIVGRDTELIRIFTAAQAGKHILLEGPVGVGKTTIALAAAMHLKRRFLRIDGDERYTEQKLAGWYDPPLVIKMGYTEDAFIHGPLSTAMLEGRILLINELNRMPEGTQNVLLSAMDEKSILIPKHGRVDALDGFQIIATQNPDEYIGTSQMSEALRDRFICIHLAYPSETDERSIVHLRSRTQNLAIINTSVSITRLSRDHREIRRGSSVRGAIDLADMFSIAFEEFTTDEQNWVDYAVPALATKIEINDPSDGKLTAVIRELVSTALREAKRAASSSPADTQPDTTTEDFSVEYADSPSSDVHLEKKKRISRYPS